MRLVAGISGCSVAVRGPDVDVRDAPHGGPRAWARPRRLLRKGVRYPLVLEVPHDGIDYDVDGTAPGNGPVRRNFWMRLPLYSAT